MYRTKVGSLPDTLAGARNNSLYNPIGHLGNEGRLILKAGRVIDPKNNIDDVLDIAVLKDRIHEVSKEIKPEKGDRVINCEGLLVTPGLIDMHLHLGDLFEVSTRPIHGAAEDGVALGLSPGAGNTFLAPSLLGAEIDRGLPINMGVYLGAVNVLGTMLSVEELIKLFKGELDEDTAFEKMTRNRIAYLTAPLTVGIKDHMGHFIMSDENIDKIFEITSKANLVFMSHTQDPAHAERVVSLSKGRPVHLGHATAPGCGTHDDPVESMKAVINLLKQENVTGEFVTTMLRKGLGSRDGLQMTKASQQLAYDALEKGIVDILISDGQNDATMKGFGDTRDNVPAIIELAQMGVLSLSQAIATMTANPAKLLAERTGNKWFTEEVGNLSKGALANITVIDENDKLATYTIVNGEIVAFENRAVRRGEGAGGWVSKFGMVRNTGVGDLAAVTHVR
ncbi:amidohydrolase family protein [Clostridium polynesiense]|uniref:amidohydrolase family protein n=1 Tax=Clostridium polynesiense TaxID=1325933 RepID=UPI00058AFDF4|nr:amidohydrolase family protein [Clostridium polynesiense]